MGDRARPARGSGALTLLLAGGGGHPQCADNTAIYQHGNWVNDGNAWAVRNPAAVASMNMSIADFVAHATADSQQSQYSRRHRRWRCEGERSAPLPFTL